MAARGPASRRRWRRIAAAGAPAALPALCVLGLYARSALRSYPSFDGALNLNVAASVAAGHGYGFRYDSVFAFPAQTDGPFVLPAALLFRLFGIGLVTAQLVSLAYLIGFALVVMALLRRMGAAPWRAGAASLACLLTPGMGDYAVGGYGEIPMLTWLLAGYLAAGRQRFGLAGLLLGLAAITKTVALLCVAPSALICTLFVATGPEGRRLRVLAALAGGLLAPVLGWELFRMASVGGPAAWERWWALQLGQVGQQSGADELAGPAAALAKLHLHLGLLSDQVAVPAVLLSCWLVVPWLLALGRLAARRTPRDRALPLCLLLVCSTLYAVWWLLVTPTDMAWLRRILPGLLLQTCLVAALAQVPGSARPWRWPATLVLLVLLVLPGETMMLRHGVQVSPRPPASGERHRTDRLVDRLRALPADAVIFGVGWWQAPLFALLSGRTIMNLDLWDAARIDALPHKYFVVDPAAADLAGSRLAQVWRTATLAPLLHDPDMALYRLVAIDPDRGLQDPAPLVAGFDGRAVPQTSGWWLPDGDWAWVSPRSRIRLGRRGQTRLVLDAAFWDELFVHGPRHLHAEAAGCLDQTVTVPSSGSRRIVFPLRCPPSPAMLPMTVTLTLDAAMPHAHQLDADTRDLAYQVRRLMLEP